MKKFSRFVLIFVFSVLFCCFICVSSSAADSFSDSPHNLPYITDYNSSNRFTSLTIPGLFPNDPYLIECPTVFYTYSAANLRISFLLENASSPSSMMIYADSDGGHVSVLNRSFSFPVNGSAYVSTLLFIVYDGYITCYTRNNSFSDFLFEIKYDISLPPLIFSADRYSYDIAYLIDPSLHTNLASLGMQTYQSVYSAGYNDGLRDGSPVYLDAQPVFDGVLSALLVPITSVFIPIQRTGFLTPLLIALSAFVILAIVIKIIKLIRGD